MRLPPGLDVRHVERLDVLDDLPPQPLHQRFKAFAYDLERHVPEPERESFAVVLHVHQVDVGGRARLRALGRKQGHAHLRLWARPHALRSRRGGISSSGLSSVVWSLPLPLKLFIPLHLPLPLAPGDPVPDPLRQGLVLAPV
jgi:hypothetical protein